MFFLNVGGLYLDAVTPVFEQQVHLCHELGIGRGHVVYGIARIIHTGKGLEIGKPVGFKESHNAPREIIGGIKCQVLQGVRQTRLVVGLVHCSHVLVKIELCLARR